MSVELLLTIIGTAATAVGLIVAGFWAVAKVAGKQFEGRLETRFEVFRAALQDLQRVGGERLQKLENKYEALDGDVRRILIELPRDYVARTDYIRLETVMEAKIDQLGLRIENWVLRNREESR